MHKKRLNLNVCLALNSVLNSSFFFLFYLFLGCCVSVFYRSFPSPLLSHRHLLVCLFCLNVFSFIFEFSPLSKSVCPCHNNRPAVVVTAWAGEKSLAVVVWRLPVQIGCNASTC